MGYHVDTRKHPKGYLPQQNTSDKETSLELIHYLDKAYDKLRDIQYQMISDSSIENTRKQLDELVNMVADARSNLSNYAEAYPIGSHVQRDKL